MWLCRRKFCSYHTPIPRSSCPSYIRQPESSLVFHVDTSCLSEPVTLATSVYTRAVLSDKGYKPPGVVAHCSASAEIPQPHSQWLLLLKKVWSRLFRFKEKRPRLAFYGRSWVALELKPEARASGETGAVVCGLQKSLLFRTLRFLGK